MLYMNVPTYKVEILENYLFHKGNGSLTEIKETDKSLPMLLFHNNHTVHFSLFKNPQKSILFDSYVKKKD